MNGIKQELERRRRTLTDALQTSKELGGDGVDHHETNKDPYGSASLIHDGEMAADLAGRRARELTAIDRALADIEAGRYGVCQDCGNAIAAKRLRALPLAARCVACQAMLETAARAA